MKGWCFEMLESIIKNYDELPLFLNAKNLSKVLGLSESSVYELMHEKGFPSICIGSRLVVPKEPLYREQAGRSQTLKAL